LALHLVAEPAVFTVGRSVASTAERALHFIGKSWMLVGTRRA
jgi:hypothetical protein